MTTLACFDLDGCLVDSTAAIPRCFNLALAAVALPPQPEASLVRFIGPPLAAGFRTLLAELGADPALAATCVAAYREHYPDVSRAATTVVPGIVAALDALAHHRLVVVTSKPRAFAAPLAVAVGLADRFAAIHGPDLTVEDEPKAVTLARALAAHGAAARDAVMVGDRRHDVEAGRACGTRTVAVTWGSGSRAELEAAAPDHLLDRPEQLVAVV